VVATLILGVFMKIMVFFYAGLTGIIDIFQITKIKYRNLLIIALSILILVYSIKMASNFTEHINIGLKKVPIFLHLPLQTGVPVLLFLITLFRQKINKKNSII
jgi:spore germination protein KB